MGYGPARPRGEQSPHAFFPLYPVLVRGAAFLLRADGFAAGLGVSIACFFLAGLLFAAEGRRRLGEEQARRALFFLLLYPTAFFFVSMYSESLFLLLALCAFLFVRRERFFWAALFGLLAGLTRVTALALVAPLAIEAWSLSRRAGLSVRADRRALGRAILCGLPPALGVLLWILAAGWMTGEPGLYFHVQEAWHRGGSPLTGFVRWAQALPARIARGDHTAHPSFLLDYGHALLFFLIGAYQARRRRFSDAAWTAGALLLPISSGISASLPRYVLVVYPAFYALAEFFEQRPRLRLLWWCLSALLLLAGTAAFVHWRWVA